MTNIVIESAISQHTKSLHLYKQVIATFASCLLSISGGLAFGYTAVLLPQLKDDKNYPYEESYDSWIASIAPLAMVPGCIMSGFITDMLGRRTTQLVLVFPYIIGWVITAFGNSNALMLIGRFITGLCAGANRPSAIVYIGEITDPKYRSIALFCTSMVIHIGSLLSHTLGNYVHRRISCLIFALPSVICFIILMFMQESPMWLISKGKVDAGIKTFQWYRGDSEESQKELASILENQKANSSNTSPKGNLRVIFSKSFMKSLFTIFLLFLAVQWCGINMISFYAQDIFKKTFSGEVDAFLLMLATDCIRVIAATGMCIFAKMMPRKITFLICCFGTTILLVFLVIYLYFNPPGLISLAVTLMVAYIAAASALTSLSWSFVAEIFPGNLRGFGSGVSSAISFGLLFISVKVTPSIMNNFGETVMYAIFAFVTLICAVLLCFILPETNGKSLQDIEDTLYKKDIKLTKISSNTSSEPV